MRHQEFDSNTWATTARFKTRNASEYIFINCGMPNEKRYANCPSEKLLGEYRTIQYTPTERIVLIKGMGATQKLSQICTICQNCIHNKSR